MRKKKLWAKLMAAALSAAMVLGLMPTMAFAATSSDTISELAAGTYVGDAVCEPDEDEDFDSYTVTVNVTVADGKITEITAEQDSTDADDATYFSKAANGTKSKTGVIDQIITNNSTEDIDAVSSATCSSNAIIDAVDAALASDPVTAVDKTDLNEAIESVALLSESDYTEDSWETLQTALDAAETVAAAEDATQEEVDAAATALAEAIESLEAVDVLDTSGLAEAISSAEELTESDYTSESWAVLETALSEGETVLADENATQEEVDAAAAAITSAIAALVLATSSDAEPVYVTMNIPYGDFFNAVAPSAEQAEEHASVDTVSYATSKYGISDDGEGDRNTAGTSKGTYDDGTSVKGVYYAVKMDADTYEELKDSELTEGDDYYFDEVSEEEPSSYLTLTYSDGVYSFNSEGMASAGTEEADLDALTYTSSYGDYMFELLNVKNNGTYSDGSGTGLSIDGEKVTIAVEYLTFSDGSMIALYNVDNIWMGTRYNHQIAWSVVNGNGYHKGHNNSDAELCYQYTMTDYTLSNVEVVTDKGVYTYTCDMELLPYYDGEEEFSATAEDGDSEVSVSVPSALEDVTVSVSYTTGSGRNATTVYVAENASVADGKVNLTAAINQSENGTYTILIESSNYAPKQITLEAPMTEDQESELEALVEEGNTLLEALAEIGGSYSLLEEHVAEGEELLENDAATSSDAAELIEELTTYVGEAKAIPVYLTMNIPYSVFFNTVASGVQESYEYSADVTEDDLDTVSYATSKYGISDEGEGKRATSGTSKGTYNDGTYVKGVYYAVETDLSTYLELDSSELTEGDDYYFDAATTDEPDSWLTLTYDSEENAYSFDKEGLTDAGSESAEISALTYTSTYGDYMFELLNVENNGTYSDGSGTGLSIDGEEVTIAVEYLTFSDGSMIALYNVDNIWMGSRYNHQIAWSVVNGKGLYKGHNNSSNPLCYQYDMSDYTLVSVSVVTDLGVYTYECEQELLPYYSGTGEVTVEAQDGSDEVTVTVPDEFEGVTVSVYYSTGSGRNVTTVYVANAASLSADGVITLDEVIDCDTNGTYTILVESSNYAPVTVTLDPLMSESQIETLTELAEIGEAVGTDDNTTLSEHVAEAREMLASADSTYYSEAAELIEELEGYVLSAVKTYAENIVASVDSYAESDYTVVSWSDLQTALTAANEALEDGSSYTDIYETTVSLSEAIAALTAAGDTTSLTEAIANANALEETDYTVASWEALQDAIAAAEEAIAARAEQDTLDELQAAIEAAVTALVAAGDTTEIEEAIEEAKAKNETDYTAASWEALQEAIVAAEEAVAARADDDELAAAVAALTAAMEALEAVDVTELESAITSAEALTESDYTSDSWAALQSALTAAKEALEARESQEAIDAAAANLQAAISALVKASADDTDTDALTDTTSDSSSSSSSTTSTDSSTASTSSSSTATGDSTDLWIWIMLAMAAVAAGGVAVKRRKNF